MAAAATLGLSGFQAFQQYKQGKQQAAAIREQAAYQAAITDINQVQSAKQAADVLDRGQEEADQYRSQIAGLVGTQATSFAASGVDISRGSALRTMEETAKAGEMDALTIKRNAVREAYGIKFDAMGSSLQGKLMQKAAMTNARATAATGGLQALGTLGQGGLNYYKTFR